MSGGPGPDNNAPAGAPPVAPAIVPPAPAAAVAAPETAAPAQVPAPAPAVETVVPAAVVPAAPAAVEPAPAAGDKPPAAAEPAKPAEPTSLLSGAPKPGEAAPAAEGEAPAAEGAPPAEPAAAAPLPTYEFAAPEGFTVAPEQMGKFNELLGTFEQATGGDHVKFGEHGQKLIEFHVAELQRVTAEIDRRQTEGWETLRDEWRTTFRADPDLGGNRETATLTNCAAVIDQFGGNAQQRADLRKWLAVTGLGDHPAMIRMLNNVQKVLGEPKPIPALTPANKPSRASRRYANSQNGA